MPANPIVIVTAFRICTPLPVTQPLSEVTLTWCEPVSQVLRCFQSLPRQTECRIIYKMGWGGLSSSRGSRQEKVTGVDWIPLKFPTLEP